MRVAKDQLLGPSPHAWGLLPKCAPRRLPTGHPHMRGDYGFYPLCRFVGAGHPHMRGDYVADGAELVQRLGPSPHAWGLPPHPWNGGGAGRAIPTCVGTTRRLKPKPLAEPGPSPHAWGLLEKRFGRHLRGRAIPTCVGTTGQGMRPARRSSGHPHMRGDYGSMKPKRYSVTGPSPHAWGLLR